MSMAFAFIAAPACAQDANTGLLGNVAGLRSILGNEGISLGLNDSENLLGNLSGGVKTGATLQGLATATLDVDTGKMFGLAGGAFHISALQIHGQPLSPYYLHTLQTANGNEAEDTTRLWEFWYDQQCFNNKFDIKIGQQSIDNEFIGSTYSGLFINTMAGWPLIPSFDLFGGGPAYPLSSLGIRVQAPLSSSVNILAGVFDDNPGGGAFNRDAQVLDHNGTRFSLNTGALFIAELQYTTKVNNLDGTYKLGLWYDTGNFPDQHFGTDGFSLASPASNGNPQMHHGNDSVYGIIDQTVWASHAKSLNLFGRIMAAPDAQNLIDFSFNGGLAFTAPFPGRDNDKAGIDFDIGRVSRQAANFDKDAGLSPRSTEELIELTYQAQATKWLILQPAVQYIIHPGATYNLRNEVVAGARSVITF